MKFEQAFYTRGENLLNEREGLGIAAASKTDTAFLSECMQVAGRFNTERSREKAEFVLYLNQFDTFVGVGVSPAYNMYGDRVNKLCHMYLPLEVSHTPESYYLNYPFASNVEIAQELETVELEPCLDVSCFSELIKKYGFSREVLAEFLFQLYQILFENKDRLLIVLDDEQYKKEDCFVIAREIMWLASYLVPSVGEEAFAYQKMLSYAVNSEDNLLLAKFAFSTKEDLYENRFYLGKTCKEQLPQIYKALAEKAISSYPEFAEFVSQLNNSPIMEEQTERSIQVSYIYWKLQQGNRITWEEIEPYFVFLRRKAKGNMQYRDFLCNCVLSLEDIPRSELIQIWKEIIKPNLHDEQPEEIFIKIVAKVMDFMSTKRLKTYEIFLQELPYTIKKQVLELLYVSENTPIQKHLLDSIEEYSSYKEVFKLYATELREHSDFMEQSAEWFLPYYLEREKKERESLADIFSNTSWRERVNVLMNVLFEQDTYIEQVEQQIGKLEDCYVILCFSKFLERCEAEQDSDRKEQAYDVAENYFNTYNEILEDEQKNRYEKWMICCEKEMLQTYVRDKGLKTIAEINIERLRVVLKEDWCEIVQSRLQDEELTKEILELLLEKMKQLHDISQEVELVYKQSIWNACKNDLEKCLPCSVTFGLELFSIWSFMTSVNAEQYHDLYEVLHSSLEYKQVENRVLEDKQQDFNRVCYGLWKQLIKEESEELKVEDIFYQENFYYQARIFISSILQKALLERANTSDVHHYFQLEVLKGQKLGENKLTIVQKCERLEKILDSNLYQTLLKTKLSDYGSDLVVRQYMKEAQVYYKLRNRDIVAEENLETSAELLHEVRKIIGTEVNLVEDFEKEFWDIMDRQKEEIDNLKKNISLKRQEISCKNIKKAQLEKELSKVEKELVRLNMNLQTEENLFNEKQNLYQRVQDTERYGKTARAQSRTSINAPQGNMKPASSFSNVGYGMSYRQQKKEGKWDARSHINEKHWNL